MLQTTEEVLGRHLDSGERLLWSGQPLGGVRLRASDALFIPFSLMWGRFAIFWEFMVFHSGAPFFFRLWGVPFVLVGIYIIFGRFFVDATLRTRTFYGVSNERVLILSGFFSQSLKSLALRTLTDVSLTEKSDQSGTITFGNAPFWVGMFAQSSWPGMGRAAVPSFELIEQAKEVYDIIRQAQKAA